MEFFSILEEFVTEFKKAYRQNQTKEYQAIYEAAREARDEAIRAAEAEKAAQLQKEAEERHAESTKAVYAQVIAVLTAWAIAHKTVSATEVVEQFKAVSRSFGADELTADEFCDSIRKLVGSKTAGKILPDTAKLLFDPAKREALKLRLCGLSSRSRARRRRRRRRRRRSCRLQRRCRSGRGLCRLASDGLSSRLQPW